MEGKGGRPPGGRQGTGFLPEVITAEAASSFASKVVAADAGRSAAEAPRGMEHSESVEDMLAGTNPRFMTHSSSTSSGPFQSFPDFSLQNKGLHHDEKHDSFGDAAPPFSRGATFKKPGKAALAPSKKWSRVEGVSMQDLLWLCDQTFVKTATHLSGQMNEHLTAELGVAMASLRREVSGPVQSSCHAVNQSILELPVSMDPCIQKAVKEALAADLAEQKELVQNVRANLTCSTEQLGAQVHSCRQELLENRAQADERHGSDLKEIKLQLSELQQRLLEATDMFSKRLDMCQEEIRGHHEEMKAELTSQLQTQVLNVDFSPLKKDFDARMTSIDEQLDGLQGVMREVHDGIADIQPRVQMLPETMRVVLEQEKGRGRRRLGSEDCDERGIQTEPPTTNDAWIQTLEQGSTKKKEDAAVKKKRSKFARSKQQELLNTRQGEKGVFTSEHDMKEKLRQELMKKAASATDKMKTTGCSQAIVRLPCFETLTFFFIVTNAIWIGVDLDLNPAMFLVDADPVFIVVENVFCTFFTFEVLVRLAAYRSKLDALRDGWLLLDILLVILMILETWVVTLIILFVWGRGESPNMFFDASFFRMARIVKMIRLSRMARLLRSIPELVIVIKAISAAGRSIAVISFFIVIIVYVFAVILGQALTFIGSEAVNHQSVTANFSSTLHTMTTLFVAGVVADNARLLEILGEVHPVLWVFAVLFVLLTSVTLMYMLIGVMVNVIQLVANSEREGMTVHYLAMSLREVLQEVLGYDPEHIFTKDDFKTILVHPAVVRVLNGADIDIYVVIDIADIIYDDFLEKEGRSMNFADLVGVFLSMRGHNDATVKDIMSMRRALTKQIDASSELLLAQIGREMSHIKQDISDIKQLQDPDDDISEEEDKEDEATPSPSSTFYDGVRRSTARGSITRITSAMMSVLQRGSERPSVRFSQ